MKPDVQRIFTKLSKEKNIKVNLEKVDLALELGGIKSMSSTLKANIKSYNNKFSTLDDLVRDLEREAKDLDKRADKFYQEVEEIKKDGQRQAKDLGINFYDTPIGKEVDRIETTILAGELETIKRGLRIKI
jgi:exonuclease VII small subunit